MTASRYRFAAGAFCVLVLAGCGGGGSSSSNNDTTAPLVMARVKDAVGLDPSHQTDGLSFNTTAEVLENLVAFRPGSFAIGPGLATKWSPDAGGTRWTFTLRSGATFSDGTPADAAAVKFNFDRWRLTSDPNRGNFEYSYYADMFGGFSGRDSRRRGDVATTVVLTLTHPFAPFLRDIAMPPFAIGSPTAIKADPQGLRAKAGRQRAVCGR